MTRCVCDDASFAARPAANERSGTGWQRVEPPQIIPKYTALLNSENYVTKRQSLKVPMRLGRRSTPPPGLTNRDAIAGSRGGGGGRSGSSGGGGTGGYGFGGGADDGDGDVVAFGGGVWRRSV